MTYSGTFLYEFDYTGGVNPPPNFLDYFPIINSENCFATPLDITFTNVNNKISFTFNYTYTDNGNVQAGMSFDPVKTFYFTSTSSLKITQFGSIPLSRKGFQFRQLTNLVITATDAPTILSSTSGREMFLRCTNFNSPINHWNTNGLTTIFAIFYRATAFNQPLNNWDTSNVTNMSSAFGTLPGGTTAFNQPLNNWNTAAVNDMSSMFSYATSFNQHISSWDVSSVTNSTDFSLGSPLTIQNSPFFIPANVLLFSFQYTGGENPAPDFANYLPIVNTGGSFGPIDSTYTNDNNSISVTFKFTYTDSNNGDGLTFENVADFYNANTTGLTISQFDIIPLSRAGLQFKNLTDLTFTASDIPSLLSNTSLVSCFEGCTNFNSPLNTLDTTNVTNMNSMFKQALTFNQPLDTWITSNVTNMAYMFYNAIEFNQNISNWNVLSVNNYTSFSVGSGLANENSPFPPIVCFKSGSKILCLVDCEEKYILVDDVKKGTFVKTHKSGYKKVELIGRSLMLNPEHKLFSKDRLYKCTPNAYHELFEDLIITGSHSILVDEISNEQRKKITELLGDIYVTEQKYRLPCCLDDKAVMYEESGHFFIYHFALENSNYYHNYGVYANGLLVESCSLRFLKELSKMELL